MPVNRFQAVIAALALCIAMYAKASPAPQTPPAQQESNVSSAAAEDKPCHWWSLGRCDRQPEVEGLPSDAPRSAPTLITIDVSRNRAYLFRSGELKASAPAATGSEKVLRKGKKTWLFHTPRGYMRVLRKIEDPVWRKPDWAFVEEGKPVPPPDSAKRLVKGHLGKYALDLGDGIMIHGTEDSDSLGRNVSHGCIRLPDDMLEQVFSAASVGTDVFIFESQQVMASDRSRLNERHTDLN